MQNVIEGLSATGLAAVAEGRAHALRVPDFVDRQLAKDLAAWFASHPHRCNYATLRMSKQSPLQQSTTDRVGAVFNELIPFMQSDEVERQRRVRAYEGLRDSLSEEYRNFLRGRENPIERFQRVLSSIWLQGATVANFDGIVPYVGVARIEGRSALGVLKEPHVDWLAPAVHPFAEQLSAIFYLEVPAHGGELEVWNVPKMRVLNDLQLDGTIRRTDLPEPIVVRPVAGDLVIINTRQPHAVKGFTQGARVVQTVFLGHRPGEPLSLWS